jgi:hypothetical protein
MYKTWCFYTIQAKKNTFVKEWQANGKAIIINYSNVTEICVEIWKIRGMWRVGLLRFIADRITSVWLSGYFLDLACERQDPVKNLYVLLMEEKSGQMTFSEVTVPQVISS